MDLLIRNANSRGPPQVDTYLDTLLSIQGFCLICHVHQTHGWAVSLFLFPKSRSSRKPSSTGTLHSPNSVAIILPSVKPWFRFLMRKAYNYSDKNPFLSQMQRRPLLCAAISQNLGFSFQTLLVQRSRNIQSSSKIKTLQRFNSCAS